MREAFGLYEGVYLWSVVKGDTCNYTQYLINHHILQLTTLLPQKVAMFTTHKCSFYSKV